MTEQLPVGYDTQAVQAVTGVLCYNVITGKWNRIQCAPGISGAISVAPGISESILVFNQILNIVDNTLSTIVSFTNSGTTEARITGIQVSGEADAEFHIVIDSVTKMIGKTSEQQRDWDKKLDDHIVAVGSTLEVKVVHYKVGRVPDFNATIIGRRV